MAAKIKSSTRRLADLARKRDTARAKRWATRAIGRVLGGLVVDYRSSPARIRYAYYPSDAIYQDIYGVVLSRANLRLPPLPDVGHRANDWHGICRILRIYLLDVAFSLGGFTVDDRVRFCNGLAAGFVAGCFDRGELVDWLALCDWIEENAPQMGYSYCLTRVRTNLLDWLPCIYGRKPGPVRTMAC